MTKNKSEEEFQIARVAYLKNKLTHNGYVSTLSEMITRVKSEPKLEMIYSGIKEKSIGVVFGPSKSGKTMFCENLAMAMAAGVDNYLGLPIAMPKNCRVLFISFEEHYTNRTERNAKQASALLEQYGEGWLDNFIVVNEEIPRYITTDDHWYTLQDIINDIEPNIVILDSLTHLYQGAIEDSKVAIELTKNLRNLSEETGTTIIAIHHTHKMYGQRLSIDTIAGSRVLAQELDFMIGLNRTPDGKKYIKDVAFRYIQSNDDTVRTYEIDDNCWLNVTGQTDEGNLLAAQDGRKYDVNRNKLFDFIYAETEAGNATIPFSRIEEHFIANGDMSKPTAFSNLQKLLDEKMIIKPSKGEYSLAA